jgi:hypothetical protein
MADTRECYCESYYNYTCQNCRDFLKSSAPRKTKTPLILGIPMREIHGAYALHGIVLHRGADGRWVWLVSRYKNTPEEGSAAKLCTARKQLETVVRRIRRHAAKLGT